MTHDEARERLVDLAYGELEPALRAAVQQHVSGCAECTSEMESMARTRAAVGLLPDPAPPGGRAELIEAARKAVKAPGPRRRTRWSRPAPWMAAAAVVLAVGGVALRWLDEGPRREAVEEKSVAGVPAGAGKQRETARAADAAPAVQTGRTASPPVASAGPAPAPRVAPGALASRERVAEEKPEAPAAAGIPRSTAVNDGAAFPPGVSGAFVSLDLRSGNRFRVNPEGCATRHPPFSTFKIPSSLIGLETGVVKDSDERWSWDGLRYPPPDPAPGGDYLRAWKEDQSLRTALSRSIVWYFREVAARVGEPRMKKWLATFAYGNQDVSGGLDRFWLGNSLRISPDEQAEFLARLERGQFPVARKNLDLVKDVLTQETGPGYRLVAKTGSSPDGEGWLVGWIDSPGAGCTFALHLKAASYEEMARVRPELARQFLRQAGCL